MNKKGPEGKTTEGHAPLRKSEATEQFGAKVLCRGQLRGRGPYKSCNGQNSEGRAGFTTMIQQFRYTVVPTVTARAFIRRSEELTLKRGDGTQPVL